MISVNFRKVAEELARMHATLPLETDERADPLHLTRTTFEHVPKTLNDPEAQKRFVVFSK